MEKGFGRSTGYVNAPLEQRLASVKEQGFSCVQLALSKISPKPVTREQLTTGYAMKLNRLFAEAGVDIAVLGCYLNLMHPQEAKIREIMKMYEAQLRFAATLNCGVVGTETGAPNAAYKYEPACRTEAVFQAFLHNLTNVVKCAEKCGVLLAIEPVTKHIVYDAKTARRVLDSIASPNLRIIYDPVNLLDSDNYPYRNEIFLEAQELLRDEIEVLHLKDFSIEHQDLIAVGAGQGMMDYDVIFNFIKCMKPEIQVSLENTTPDNAQIIAEYIRNAYAGLDKL